MWHLTLLPKLSRRGEKVARPSTSGTMLMTMPETPDLAGSPISYRNWPLASYMPHDVMLDSI